MPNPNPRAVRIKRLAVVLGSLVAAFAVYWYFNMIRWLVSLLDAETWYKFQVIENHITVLVGQKIAYFIVMCPFLILVGITFYFAIKTMWHLYNGRFFDTNTSRSTFLLGLWLVIVIAYDFVVAAVLPPILSWNNTGVEGMIDGKVSDAIGFIGPSIYLHSNAITVFLCGFGIMVMGWVFHESALIEEENKGFV